MVDEPLIYVFTVVVLADLLTGCVKPWFATTTNQKLNSTKGLLGLVKHLLVLILILVAYPFFTAMGFKLLGDFVVLFYIYTYLISILENIGQCGVKYPVFLLDKLTKLQDDYNHGKAFDKKGNDKNGKL